VASVVVTPTARRNLDTLIETLSLPTSTRQRVKASLEPLRRFPLIGAPLEGRWAGFRFILGPWRWMIVVYRYDEALDQVWILTIRDARSARPPRTTATALDGDSC
jgi:plasmid stabilization system protein ParE